MWLVVCFVVCAVVRDCLFVRVCVWCRLSQVGSQAASASELAVLANVVSVAVHDVTVRPRHTADDAMVVPKTVRHLCCG